MKVGHLKGLSFAVQVEVYRLRQGIGDLPGIAAGAGVEGSPAGAGPKSWGISLGLVAYGLRVSARAAEVEFLPMPTETDHGQAEPGFEPVVGGANQGCVSPASGLYEPRPASKSLPTTMRSGVLVWLQVANEVIIWVGLGLTRCLALVSEDLFRLCCLVMRYPKPKPLPA